MLDESSPGKPPLHESRPGPHGGRWYMGSLRRWSVTALGVALLWASMGFTAYAWAWESHKNHAQATLLQREHGGIAQTAAQSHGAACVVDGQQPGQLSGILSIPALKLSAPVEEGTDDAE